MGATAGAVAASSAMTSHASTDSLSPQDKIFTRDVAIDVPQPGLRRAVVDPDDNVLVAAGKSLLIYSPQGTLTQRVDFDRPVRCLAAGDEHITVGIRDHVRVLDRSGRLKTWLPTIGRGHLIGDLIQNDGGVMVTDITAGNLARFTDRGRWETIASRKNGFDLPAGGRFSWQTPGRLLVTNPSRHRIEYRSERGQMVSTWGKRSREVIGFQGCCNPLAAATLDDGSIVTAEAGQTRIKRFDANGNFLQQVAGPDDFFKLATETDTHVEQAHNSLMCAAGGIDLATNGGNTLWMLHSAEKQLIRWRISERA
tara:strand:- start:263028 stop:263957 length:930 start_codon:yes stop_codon:yes gene_type:complete